MMTLNEIEDAGHLECMMEAVELKKETRDWITNWQKALTHQRESEEKRLHLETLAFHAITNAQRLLSEIADGRKKASAAQVANALDWLNDIKWERHRANSQSQFEIIWVETEEKK